MAPRSLAEWLDWQTRLHPHDIQLGLERVAEVLARLGVGRPAPVVVTVAGTNGKGSTVAMLEAVLRAAGHRVASYTSPHLLRYNERIRIDGVEVGDEALCEAFARVERARGETPLTYFEFGTLAAFDLMSRSGVGVALLEVGMGGRLDAVNVVDPDLAVVTRIAMDHMQWLGPDRDAIGAEKAGITRPGCPAVCADPQPPKGFLEAARQARLYRAGRDFSSLSGEGYWSWHGAGGDSLADLPLPTLAGAHQLENAAAVVQALMCLKARLPWRTEHLQAGLRAARLAGRLQCLPGSVTRVLDVAHNPDAAAALSRGLGALSTPGRRRTVLAMLADKPAAAFAEVIADETDRWYLAGLSGSRGASAEVLAERVRGKVRTPRLFASVADACRAALADSREGDRILVTGSFYTVAEAWPVLV